MTALGGLGSVAATELSGWQRIFYRYKPGTELLRELRSSAYRRPSVANRYVYPIITGYAYISGGLLGLLSLALPTADDLQTARLVAICVVCLLIGVSVISVGHRLPMYGYHWLLGLGTVIITLAILVLAAGNPGRTVNLASLYMFIAVGCTFYFGWFPAILHLISIEICSMYAYQAVGLLGSDVLIQQGILIMISWCTAWLTRAAGRAERDSLTTLYNRRGFDSVLEQAMTFGQRSGTPVSIVLLDLDRFKSINDHAGHVTGDRVLRHTALAWKRTINGRQAIGRTGGDEFAVVAPGLGAAEAAQLADRLRAAVSQPCSAGVAQMRDDDSRSMLVSRADVALYEAKNRGGNQTRQHDVNADGDGFSRSEILAALNAGEFEVFYQPIVDLATGEVIGDEALARWRHGSRGLISPTEFVPAAERNGSIIELGRWMLEHACRDTARFNDRAIRPRRVSVNVSVNELREPDYASHVLRALSRTGLDPRRLVVEVTESTFDADDPQVLAALQTLRHFNIDVAIDDFGTGYSSLHRLNQLPVSVLKIDRIFIAAVKNAADELPVLKAIVSLADALGLTITAEGVETTAQAELLGRLGCTHGQGFYFGRPQPQVHPVA